MADASSLVELTSDSRTQLPSSRAPSSSSSSSFLGTSSAVTFLILLPKAPLNWTLPVSLSFLANRRMSNSWEVPVSSGGFVRWFRSHDFSQSPLIFMEAKLIRFKIGCQKAWDKQPASMSEKRTSSGENKENAQRAQGWVSNTKLHCYSRFFLLRIQTEQAMGSLPHLNSTVPFWSTWLGQSSGSAASPPPPPPPFPAPGARKANGFPTV